jgi:Ca-activated chloride channel family protein
LLLFARNPISKGQAGMMSMQLYSPYWLLGLVLIFPLAGLALYQRRRYPRSFSPRRFLVSTAALACCVIGMSRPQLGRVTTESRTERSQILLAVDISRSMLAKDITPNRLDFAVVFATQLLQRLPTARAALYPFALDGYMQVPFTNDLDAITDMLTSLNPNTMTNQGTDLSRALGTLYRHLSRMERGSKASGADWLPTQVILLSDGESHHPIRDEVSDMFRSARIPIYTVGTATVEGGNIPAERNVGNFGEVVKDASGKMVQSRLNAAALRQISDRSGGDYFNAKIEEVERLAGRLEQAMQMGRLSTTFAVEKETYPYFFLAAFFLFLVEFGFGRWEFAVRALLIPLLWLAMGTFPARAAEAINDDTPEPPAQDEATRSTFIYNRGVEALKRGDALKAAELFQESAAVSPTPDVKKRALYNLADVLLKQGDPLQALEAFQQAYDIRAKDRKFEQDANRKISENMALAYKILQRIKKQPKEGGEGKSGPENENNKPGSGSQDQKGPKKFRAQNFSDEEKKKIYDLVASEEQESLQRIQSERNQGQSKELNDKPW